MPYVVLPWLAEHVVLPEGFSAEQLAVDLVRVGLEEEAIHTSGVTGPVVVGRVLERTPETQKNGKVINWCQVEVGEDESRGVICGAHNFDAGDTVVVALPGAVLPGDFAIAARKTYGHVSDGMICAADELGLPKQGEGIIVLAKAGEETEFVPGQDALELLGLGDEVLEINVTPDRGYCFSVRGVAREFSHSTGAAFTDPGLTAPAGSAPQVPLPTPGGFAVEIDDDAPIRGNVGADRFVARVVRGIDPKAASPRWLTRRLEQAGMRPISLAVDATNYVMLDLGQPLHAYDLNTVSAPIVVRRARQGEELVTLDEVKRTLNGEDLLITDSPEGKRASRPIGIAGVMGGASTEVGETTTDVLIEAAHFDPISIARSARRHKLPSEASRRFERGVDNQLQAIAAQRVVDLLVTHGGGVSDDASVTDLDLTVAAPPITLAPQAVEARVGVAYTSQEVHDTLEAIGAGVVEVVDGEHREFVVTPPSWRTDLSVAVDLIEEVVRLRGYDQVPSLMPRAQAGTGLTNAQRLRRSAERSLAEAGLVQVLSYPFVAAAVHDQFELAADDPRRNAQVLVNPLGDDAPQMRTSLLASLIPIAVRNVARGNGAIAVFETGTVTQGGLAGENPLPEGGTYPGADVVAAIAAAVPAQPQHVAAVLAGTGDTHTVVGLVLRLATTLGLDLGVKAAVQAPFHPGRCAQFTTADGAVVGYAGELAPTVVNTLGLPARSLAFELDLDALVAAVGQASAAITKLSSFPLAKEDVAIVVDASVPALDVLDAVKAGAGDLAETIELFDVFEGDQVGEGKKSLAFALRLRAADRTLTAAETAQIRESIIESVGSRVGGVLRG